MHSRCLLFVLRKDCSNREQSIFTQIQTSHYLKTYLKKHPPPCPLSPISIRRSSFYPSPLLSHEDKGLMKFLQLDYAAINTLIFSFSKTIRSNSATETANKGLSAAHSRHRITMVDTVHYFHTGRTTTDPFPKHAPPHLKYPNTQLITPTRNEKENPEMQNPRTQNSHKQKRPSS